MSQARTWLLLAASSGGLAPRCDRPPLPQPPREPPPRAATPYAAGGAALVGPGCPPARVSLYPPRRLVAWGDPSQDSARHRKKIDIYTHTHTHTHIYIYIYIYIYIFLLISDWSCKGAGPAAARVFASQKKFMLQGKLFSFDCTDECTFLRHIERCAVRLHFRRFWLSSWRRGR